MSLIIKEWKNRMEENRVILYTFNSSKGRPLITFLQGIPLLAENILTGIGSQKNKNFMQPGTTQPLQSPCSYLNSIFSAKTVPRKSPNEVGNTPKACKTLVRIIALFVALLFRVLLTFYLLNTATQRQAQSRE